MPLTSDQLATFHRQGWLVLRGVIDPATLADLDAWVEQAHDWAHLDGPGLHHFEQTNAGPVIARSEDLIPHHPGLRRFICEGDVIGWVGELLGEPAVLYKEKINFKQAGGAGFAPHQDAPAYRFVDHHVSVMVPVDPANTGNGGLEFAEGHTLGTLPHTRGRILPKVADGLAWQAADVSPGDVVLFDSYTPHRSGTNTSGRARRALYLTYNARSAGDLRDTYYADKRREFSAEGHAFDDARARISVNDDFLGRPADRPARAPRRPIEDLFARYASPAAQQLYDEAITELEHGLQCAALARRDGADDATIAAALLHDVGHLLVGDLFPIDAALPRDFKHEEVGARYLARWFGPEVTEPVRLHVAAKRYLVAVDPAYAAGLTPSSTRSLAAQGGPMSADEAAAFEASPGFAAAVRVRRWDDEGKDPSVIAPAFEHWHALLRGLA
ncbi:MAG TPA: phytanoyl-CoA dioxygenase family protein [Myxococcota bacterium]|nr:phytanoyl-CoA dioxygenase family protein [Myxococcota bacterium]